MITAVGILRLVLNRSGRAVAWRITTAVDRQLRLLVIGGLSRCIDFLGIDGGDRVVDGAALFSAIAIVSHAGSRVEIILRCSSGLVLPVNQLCRSGCGCGRLG